jgi:iron complex outermembrane receptor protein
VVTGTRTHKKIIDIPYSVQRINNLQFRYQKKISISDVLEAIPGLFLQSRYGNHDVRISIRGFGSRSNSGIRGVRILLDGIPESEPDGQTRIEAIDFNSIGSIEIVKGNSSSLYTNAPGGVINFINDINFYKPFFINFNQFGSYDLRRNGFKTGVRTKDYGFLLTYSYHNFKGFREHSEDYWHIINTVFETTPSDKSNFQVLGYFVNGLIRLPGSLTKEQLNENPLQANSRDAARDAKRISKKGRLALRFNTRFGNNDNHELEITTYGTIKYFERTSNVYRIINRYGLGVTMRYVNLSDILNHTNEFSFGGDLLYQTGPIEFYRNLNGKKSDILTGLTDESIRNTGFYFQNSFSLINDKFDLLFTGRYDKVTFDQKNQILEVQNDERSFEAFTPKIALNYKITPSVAAYTSFGLSFESPAGNELDNYPTSSNPNSLLNPDLRPQDAKNFEIGIKGNLLRNNSKFFNNIYFEAALFYSKIKDEIVPFELFGDVFFRNSAETNRTGFELGANIVIVDGLKFKSAYTYSNFKYDSYSARTIELDSTGNIVTSDRDFTGNLVPSVPKHNISLYLEYEHKFSEFITGFIKGSYIHVTGLYTDDGNTEKTEGYKLVNAVLGFDVVLDKFNILIQGGINQSFIRGLCEYQFCLKGVL